MYSERALSPLTVPNSRSMYPERAPSPLTVASSSVLLAKRPVEATKPIHCTNCIHDSSEGACQFVHWAVACRQCNSNGKSETCSFRVPIECRTALMDLLKKAKENQCAAPEEIEGLANTILLLGSTRRTVEAKLRQIEIDRERLLSELRGVRVSDELLTSDLVRLLDDDLNADATHCPPDSLLVLTGGTLGFAVPGVRHRVYANEWLKGYFEEVDEAMKEA